MRVTPDPFEDRRRVWVTISWMLAGFILGQLATAIVYMLAGYSIEGGSIDLSEVSPQTVAVMLGVSQAIGYLLPGIIAGYTLYKGEWLKEVGFTPLPKIIKVLLGIVILTLSLPMVSALAQLNATLDLSDWMVDIEETIAGTITSIIQAEGVVGLISALFLMAVLPAIGEELVFRGLLQPGLIRISGHPHAGIWLTAVLFSFLHFQFAGFIPRIFLGAVLGFLAFYSQRLWIPIVAHFLFNGSQVLAVRFELLDSISPTETEVTAPSLLVMAGAIGLTVLGAILLPYLQDNRDQSPAQEAQKDKGHLELE